MAVIKNGWLKGIVNGVSTRLYAHTHSDLCAYGDPADGVTVTKKIDELNSKLDNQETIIIDDDTESFSVQPHSYKYLVHTPPQKEGYRLLSVTPRDVSGENSAYLLINTRNSGSIIVYNVESVAVECVITLRYLYKKF